MLTSSPLPLTSNTIPADASANPTSASAPGRSPPGRTLSSNVVHSGSDAPSSATSPEGTACDAYSITP